MHKICPRLICFSSLIALHKETGDTEVLASFYTYQAYQSCACIDPVSGDFYWISDSFDTSGIYKIDMRSYEPTKVRS